VRALRRGGGARGAPPAGERTGGAEEMTRVSRDEALSLSALVPHHSPAAAFARGPGPGPPAGSLLPPPDPPHTAFTNRDDRALGAVVVHGCPDTNLEGEALFLAVLRSRTAQTI
jgi:hypothetical protein